MLKRSVVSIALFLSSMAHATFVESLWSFPVVQKLATAVDGTRESEIEIYDLTGATVEKISVRTGDRVRFLLLNTDALAYMKQARRRVQILKAYYGSEAGREKVVDTLLDFSLELATSFEGIVGRDISFLQLKWLARGIDMVGEGKTTYFVPRILTFSAQRKADDGRWRSITCGLRLTGDVALEKALFPRH